MIDLATASLMGIAIMQNSPMRERENTLYPPPHVAGVLRGNTIRGNRARNSEGKMTL